MRGPYRISTRKGQSGNHRKEKSASEYFKPYHLNPISFGCHDKA